MRWKTISYIISSLTAVALFITIIGFPLFMIILLQKKFESLHREDSRKRFGAMYNEIKFDNRAALLYNVIFVLRRIAFSGTVLLLPDHPTAQVQLLILQSIMVIIYIGTTLPFEDSFLNKLEIFNEICILIAAYHLLPFTNFQPDDDIQYIIGWSLIAITALNVISNMLIIIRRTYLIIKQNFWLYVNKIKRLFHSIKYYLTRKEAKKGSLMLPTQKPNLQDLNRIYLNLKNKTSMDSNLDISVASPTLDFEQSVNTLHRKSLEVEDIDISSDQDDSIINKKRKSQIQDLTNKNILQAKNIRSVNRKRKSSKLKKKLYDKTKSKQDLIEIIDEKGNQSRIEEFTNKSIQVKTKKKKLSEKKSSNEEQNKEQSQLDFENVLILQNSQQRSNFFESYKPEDKQNPFQFFENLKNFNSKNKDVTDFLFQDYISPLMKVNYNPQQPIYNMQAFNFNDQTNSQLNLQDTKQTQNITQFIEKIKEEKSIEKKKIGKKKSKKGK